MRGQPEYFYPRRAQWREEDFKKQALLVQMGAGRQQCESSTLLEHAINMRDLLREAMQSSYLQDAALFCDIAAIDQNALQIVATSGCAISYRSWVLVRCYVRCLEAESFTLQWPQSISSTRKIAEEVLKLRIVHLIYFEENIEELAILVKTAEAENLVLGHAIDRRLRFHGGKHGFFLSSAPSFNGFDPFSHRRMVPLRAAISFALSCRGVKTQKNEQQALREYVLARIAAESDRHD